MENEQKQSIEELAKLLHDNKLSEIEYEANGVYLRVVGPKAATEIVAAPAPAVPMVPSTPAVPAVTGNAPLPDKKPENHIVSPMVGVVYLSKDPHSPAFVKVGDKVSVGQTVCLVEAMKTFNPIKSDKAGTISAILVESGSPVEYNQPLFNVE